MSKGTLFKCKGEIVWYLSDYPSEDVYEPLTNETLLQQTTLEQLADLCDGDAESSNNHSFVGAHRVLAALLHQQLGREQATRILFEIASHGGLDGMAGIGGKNDAFADFGIKDCWADWKLK